jgi:hypothetical protein
VFPSSAIDDWSKSEISEVDMGEGWGVGYLFDSADVIPPSRLAHAKSDVSDLANVNPEIGNYRFRMARDIAMQRIAFF